jgi:hypothetical protein
VTLGTELHADEAPHWDPLEFLYDTHRINHSEAFSTFDACTNQAESYFSRLRRAIVGQHHHVSHRYLHQYATEAGWREDHRRQANGTQHTVVLTAALHSPVSRNWKGYWQRAA